MVKGQRMEVLSVNHSEQLPDSISFCFVFLVFSRDSNMISIGTVKFRYYVAIIIPVNLGKP